MLQYLSYSNDNTRQSSLLFPFPSFFSPLCFLISCPGAFIIGHLSSAQVVDSGRHNWHSSTTSLATPTDGHDWLAHSGVLEHKTPLMTSHVCQSWDGPLVMMSPCQQMQTERRRLPVSLGSNFVLKQTVAPGPEFSFNSFARTNWQRENTAGETEKT